MRRKCDIFERTDLIKKELGIDNNYKISLYIDRQNSAEILNLILNNISHFRRILFTILNGRVHTDLYEKIKNIAPTKGLSEMKFKGRSNPRIYCREFKEDGKNIVMIFVLPQKGSQKINKTIKSKLEAIAEYGYDF